MMTTYPTYKLGEICEIVYGKGLPTKNLKSEGFPVFGANGIIGFNDVYLYENEQVLISCRGAYSGKINMSPKQCFVTNNSLIILPKHDIKIDRSFLFYALQTANKEKLVTGTAQPQVTINNAIDLKIPLPPLATQHAIVAHIEELFSKLDSGVASLCAAQQQLKVYRQAVLNEQLTKGQWNTVRLGEVAETCLGKMLDKNKNKGRYSPYLRNINVRWGTFDLDNLQEMRFEESEEERYGINKGDLIICEGGEPGRCAIWNEDLPNMKIQKALHRVRLQENMLGKYIYYYMLLYAQNGVLENYFTGTTIKHLTGESLKQILFPLPSLSEQQQIVREIESRLSVCDKVEQQITEALQKAEALRQSILQKAFSGELV